MSAGLSLDDPRYFDLLHTREQAHWWPRAMWQIASAWIDRAMAGETGLSALDVGCGAGGTLSRLVARAEFREVIGIDPNPAARDLARKVARAIVLPGDALELPFPGSCFDLVTCFDVFQHLPAGSDAIAAAELVRVLRPGGFALIRANGRGIWPDDREGSRPYRLRELSAVVRRSGMRIVRASSVNAVPAVISELVGLATLGRAGGHPSGAGLRAKCGPSWASRWMGAVASIEAIAVGRFGLRLPVGHSTLVLARKPSEDRR